MIRSIFIIAIVAAALTPATTDARRQHRTPIAPAAAAAPAPDQGPNIALGARTGDAIAVNATTAGAPFLGFNIHVAAQASAGVTITSVAGGDVDGAFCFSSRPAAGELVFGCVTAPPAPTTGPDALTSIRVAATGDGCVTVRLVDVAPTSTDAEFYDTYTIYLNGPRAEPQLNAIDTTATRVLVGAGRFRDCPAG